MKEDWPQPMHDALLQATKEVKTLQPYRNIIIHSTWTRDVDERWSDTQPRPWGKRDNDHVWTAFRSRQRTYAPDSEWTISDIILLAIKMAAAGRSLRTTFAKMQKHLHPERFPRSHWQQWLSEAET